MFSAAATNVRARRLYESRSYELLTGGQRDESDGDVIVQYRCAVPVCVS